MYQRATLPNGLRIVCETMPDVASVSVGLWVEAGSRDEDPAEEGVSHLIEHMLFKGTRNRSARAIAEAIDAVGGQLNAFTTREYTCFYAKILADHLPLGLELLADMYSASAFAEDEIAKEKGVIIEEIKSYEDAPDELVHDLLAAAFWPDHPLGRPILGTPASVGRLTRDDVMSYLDRHYRPEKTVLAAAGRVDFSEVHRLALAYLGDLPPGRTAGARTPPQPGKSRVIRRKEIEQVHLCLGGRGVARTHPDKYAVYVLDSILGGSVSSRLFQSLREDRGLVYAAGSTHATFRDVGLFSIYAGTAVENVDEVLRLIRAELDRLMEEPVGPKELARAKEQLRGTFLLSLESTSTRMSRLAKAALFYDSFLTPPEVTARIQAVTAADVSRAARAVFGTGPLAAAVVAPPGLAIDLDRLLAEEVAR
ncbi:MAG: M16 family metallopeptidase [Bacteroidota bacterium]